MKQKTILITGASGFVGTWLANEAFETGYTIIGIDVRAPHHPQIWEAFATSSLETVDLIHLLEKTSLHAVLHLAGSASVLGSINNPYGDFSSLLPGTARLALYIAKFQPQARLFLFSSAAVYGNPKVLPITEETPTFPVSPYGVHKALAEDLLLKYSRLFDLKFTIFRIFSIYGPGLRKQLIWDISQKAFSAVNSGEQSILLYGTGKESRDFIYIKDLCKAVLLFLTDVHALNGEIINIASGKEVSIQELAECLISHLKVNVTVTFDGIVRNGDPLNWRANATKLYKHNYNPEYSLNDGLEQIAKWATLIFNEDFKNNLPD